jgi:hypothetical protein
MLVANPTSQLPVKALFATFHNPHFDNTNDYVMLVTMCSLGHLDVIKYYFRYLL